MKKKPKIVVGSLIKLKRINKLNKMTLFRAKDPFSSDAFEEYITYTDSDEPLLYLGAENILITSANSKVKLALYKFLFNEKRYYVIMRFSDTLDNHFEDAFEVYKKENQSL